MIKRAILIVWGNVQEAGYRGTILKCGQKLGLKGYIENLPDGSVRIICEAKEKVIEKFIKSIEIKTTFVNVENIEKSFEEPTGEFNNFYVKFGDKISDLGLEIFQGFGTARKYLEGVKDEVQKTTDEIRKVGEKVDQSKNEITQHLDQSRDQMIEHIDGNFNSLDEKYHIVSETLIAMNKNLIASQEQLREVVSNLTTIVREFVENKKMLRKMNDD